MPKTDLMMVKRFREATGMGWLASKLFLKTAAPELCERIITAGQEQSNRSISILHDPIEDDPEYAPIIAAVGREVEHEVRREIAAGNTLRLEMAPGSVLEDWPRGTCHLFWQRKKDRLFEKGINWYSPLDMNPGCIFD